MLKQLLTTTALVLVLAVPAWAEDPAQAPDSSTSTLPAADAEAAMGADAEDAGAVDSDAAAAPAEELPLEDVAAEEPAVEPEEPIVDEAATAAEDTTEAAAARAVPEAVIPAQDESEVRAGELVGMTVVSADGQEVGEVYDLIFDDQEKLSGIVVGMGGFLGIGEKLVGIDWTKAELQADPESDKERLFVGLTAADLEAAPDFMTKEDLQSAAEAEAAAAAAAAAQTDMGAAPAPATTDPE